MIQDSNKEVDFQVFAIENIIAEIVTYLENVLSKTKQKLKEFIEIFNKKYPIKDNPRKRGEYEALTWVMMKEPLILHAIGMNGSAVIELYSVLERFAVREVENIVKTPKKSSTLSKTIERYNLVRSTRILKECGILENSDLQLANNLSRLRNAAAHKNPKKIPNILKSEDLSWLDVTNVLSKVNCVPLMMESLNFVYKLYKYSQPKNNSLQ